MKNSLQLLFKCGKDKKKKITQKISYFYFINFIAKLAQIIILIFLFLTNKIKKLESYMIMKVIGTKNFIINSLKTILYLTFSIWYTGTMFLLFITSIIEMLLWALSIADSVQLFIVNIIWYAYLIIIFILFLYFLSNIPSTFQHFKIYNKISISKWREKLLAFGFTEILEGSSFIPNLDDKQFIIKGKNYENLPMKIQSSGKMLKLLK